MNLATYVFKYFKNYLGYILKPLVVSGIKLKYLYYCSDWLC